MSHLNNVKKSRKEKMNILNQLNTPQYDLICSYLKLNKSIIIYGACGTGRTYLQNELINKAYDMNKALTSCSIECVRELKVNSVNHHYLLRKNASKPPIQLDELSTFIDYINPNYLIIDEVRLANEAAKLMKMQNNFIIIVVSSPINHKAQNNFHFFDYIFPKEQFNEYISKNGPILLIEVRKTLYGHIGPKKRKSPEIFNVSILETNNKK